jgi:hypothetical protein
MKQTIHDLTEIVKEYSLKIGAIPEKEFSLKTSPDRWSKKEVLGHLIDSAQNNLRRFICGQYESAPQKIVYSQNDWVAMNAYQQSDSQEIILLWALLNKRIAAILQQMPTAAYTRLSDTGKNSVETHTLEFLAEDYVKHLKHHLNQIIPNSFDIRYPS